MTSDRPGQGDAGSRAPRTRSPEEEPELRRLDRLAAVGRLAADIVHEIRNPLVSIKTFVSLLPERLDDREFRERFVQVVGDEVRRIERMLERVLDHARPSAEGPPRADLPSAVDAALGLLDPRLRAGRVQVERRTGEGLPPVPLHADALRQVVLNLLLNAVEASPQGGRLELSAEAHEDGVTLVVRDQGPGIPPELRERVFEPFFSTKRERAGGLGLAISRRIAEEAGGRLELADTPPPGATFRLQLPRAS